MTLVDPKFTYPIGNVTASVGRDAFLTCVVQDLGSYKVSVILNLFIIVYNYIHYARTRLLWTRIM